MKNRNSTPLLSYTRGLRYLNIINIFLFISLLLWTSEVFKIILAEFGFLAIGNGFLGYKYGMFIRFKSGLATTLAINPWFGFDHNKLQQGSKVFLNGIHAKSLGVLLMLIGSIMIAIAIGKI